MSVNQEYFLQIVEQCRGCGHVTPGEYCDRYANPGLMWSPYKRCISRTHNRTIQVASEKTVNPLKASKRAVTKIGGI
jgi:hypothetical protein